MNLNPCIKIHREFSLVERKTKNEFGYTTGYPKIGPDFSQAKNPKIEMELPSVETVAKDYDSWKSYSDKLIEVLERASDCIIRSKAIDTISDYFESYVPKSKNFDSSKVFARFHLGDTNKRYTYNHDGVSIQFFGRYMWCLDDYDYVVDVKIIVDGVTILNLEKM
jgi:hypothetical protein